MILPEIFFAKVPAGDYRLPELAALLGRYAPRCPSEFGWELSKLEGTHEHGTLAISTTAGKVRLYSVDRPPLVITITGELAAGKSVFLRIIAEALAARGIKFDLRDDGLPRSLADLPNLPRQFDSRGALVQTKPADPSAPPF